MTRRSPVSIVAAVSYCHRLTTAAGRDSRTGPQLYMRQLYNNSKKRLFFYYIKPHATRHQSTKKGGKKKKKKLNINKTQLTAFLYSVRLSTQGAHISPRLYRILRYSIPTFSNHKISTAHHDHAIMYYIPPQLAADNNRLLI